jgi:hypothetical protein
MHGVALSAYRASRDKRHASCTNEKHADARMIGSQVIMRLSIVLLAGSFVFSALSCAPPGKARPPSPPEPTKPASPVDTGTGTFGKPRTTARPPIDEPLHSGTDPSKGPDD